MWLFSPNPINQRGSRRYIAWALCATLAALISGIFPASTRADNAPAAAGSSDEVVHYLQETVDWYRQIAGIDQASATAAEVLSRDTVRQNSKQVLRLAFDYARGQAAILAEKNKNVLPVTTGAVSSATLAQNMALTAQRMTQYQAQMDKIDGDLQKVSPTSRPILQAKRDKVAAQLNLVTARHDVLQSYMGFLSGADSGSAEGLAQKIDDLQRSIPDAMTNEQKASMDGADSPSPSGSTAAPAATPAVPVPAVQVFRPESAGLFGLVTEMFTLSHNMNELNELIKQASKLHDANEKLRVPLRDELSDANKRGDVIGALPDTDSPDVLLTQRKELEALTQRYKLLAAATVPLGEQNLLLDSTSRNLVEWKNAIGREYSASLHYLLFRLGGTALTIIVLFGISEVWRRATFRYVHDVRRRRQLMLVRRIVLGIIIVLVVIASFVTEIGSLATFAGLITAGIAVALQTVILSGVAYFFFIGRFGVKVGDRVTIGGITGDVLEIGLFRFYMMELAGEGRDLHPTGRIVVFSNAVLFQPNAFFKQLPGADYIWHEVVITLSADSEYDMAEKKILAAVESVFMEYKDVIEKQYEGVKDSIHIDMEKPEPAARLRFVGGGLEVVVRYPVEIQRAPEIDDRVTRLLLETIENEPSLHVAEAGSPKIKSVK